ncbi:MAG: hypothetical protein AB7P20_16370 [Rhizobiaceae bacterium]
MAHDENCLTGVWNGRYSYPFLLSPVSFVATLIETKRRLGGSTHEANTGMGAAGAMAFAILDGARDGSRVTFTKTYENLPADANHPIQYIGTLSTDGAEISGQWNIPGHWSGNFVMIRSQRQAIASNRRIAARA